MSALPENPVASFSLANNPKPVILLVEDEPVVREVTRQVLEHAGYLVIECAGPQEALLLARQHRGHIGLLLSDVVMPGMNGPDLARQLQQEHPGLVTVFMSGYAEHDVMRQAMQELKSIYIRKPFTISLLLARVAEAIHDDPHSAEGKILSRLSS